MIIGYTVPFLFSFGEAEKEREVSCKTKQNKKTESHLCYHMGSHMKLGFREIDQQTID